MARRVRASTLENRSARLKLDAAQEALPLHGHRARHRGRISPLPRARAAGCCAPPTAMAPIGPTPLRSPTITSRPTARLCSRSGRRRTRRACWCAARLPATARPRWQMRSTPTSATWRRAAAWSPMRAVVRKLIPATLLARPVGLLTFRELRHWRDGLLDGRKAASVNRTCKSLKAALNLAAVHDPRIGNTAVWRNALAGLPDAHTARHVGLPERDVRAIVAAAYAVDPSLGLWTEVAAITGARPSQIARLDVGDLQDESRRSAPDDAVVEKGQGPQARRAPPGADPAGTGGQVADGRRKAPCRRCAADPARRHAVGCRQPRPAVCQGRGAGRARARHRVRIAPLIDHPCAVSRRANASGCGHARHLRGDHRDATMRGSFSITPTQSAGARCSTCRCSHEPWRPVRLPVEGPGWIAYAAALKAAIDRFQSTPLAIAKLDSASQARAVRCKIESIGNPPELRV